MHLIIAHETVYRYQAPLRRSTQYLRLTPRSGTRQSVLRWSLDLPAKASQTCDAYGNILHVLTLEGAGSEIHLVARGEVVTGDAPPEPDPLDELPAPLFLRASPLTQPDAVLRDFAAGFARETAGDAMAALQRLMLVLGEHMPYTPGYTDAATPAAEAFAGRLGVCQDHAQVFVTCARLLGLPACYVSGYLATDASHVASHAWAEVRLPGEAGGWLGFDVSNQCLADGRYVKLAIGADYLDACPVRGVRQGGGSELLHTVVQVTPAEPAQQ